jgi:hypothetical protein
MIQIEAATADRREGIAASTALLLEVLERKGCDYDTFVLSLALLCHTIDGGSRE